MNVVAMLGVLGWFVQEIFHFPWIKSADPVAAHDNAVAAGGMWQLLLFLGFLEVFGAFALKETLEGEREPGYFGFDPLGMAKTPEAMKTYQLKEIKNGRLAMCAFGGLYHAYLMSHEGALSQLSHFKGIPGHVF